MFRRTTPFESLNHVLQLDEDGNDSGQRRWTLDFQESVYDQALLTTMVRLPRMEDRCAQACIMFSLTMLLFVNVFLQVTVLEKVVDLTKAMELEMEDRVILADSASEVRPICRTRQIGEMGTPNRLNSSWAVIEDEEIYTCSPIAVAMMSNTSTFDADADGYWTAPEAAALSEAWAAKYHRVSNNEQAVHHLLSMAKQGKLQAQQTGTIPQAQWSSATKDYTALPMDWLEKEVPRLELCLVVHEELCGNLEERGALAPRLTAKHPADRVRDCRELLAGDCRATFGQIFTFFQLSRGEVCGNFKHSFLPDIGVQLVESVNWLRYAGNPIDAVVSPFFRAFLMLILTLWFMAMLTEVRLVVDWWAAVYLVADHYTGPWFPPPHQYSSRGYTAAQLDPDRPADSSDNWPVLDGPEEIRITKVPKWVKVYTVVMALLPRTLIAFRLSWAGTIFLAASTNYTDLILNAVALTVLIDVDEYLFAAVVGSGDRAVHGLIVPLEAPVTGSFATWLFPRRRFLPVELTLTLFLIVLTNYAVYSVYVHADDGIGTFEFADALTCYCQAEGTNCLTAQVLGGKPWVKEVYADEPLPSVFQFVGENVMQTVFIFRDAIPNLLHSMASDWF